VKKVQEYLRRADDCRRKAGAALTPETERQYRELAEMWDQLAQDRRRTNLKRSGKPKDNPGGDEGAA